VLIDWFTVIAQIVNFLILIALLKVFLYGRIVRAMDEREQKIASRLEEAEKKREEAEHEAESYRQKNRELDEERQGMLSQAKEDAEARRKTLIQQARQEVEDLEQKWQEAVDRERASFIQSLRQMATGAVYAIARRALKDVANADLEGSAMEVFLDRIRKMKQSDRKELVHAIQTADRHVIVRSSFEIPTKMRQRMTRGIHEHIADGIDVAYETGPEMVLGIELLSPGRKIAWSLEDYLQTLESEAREALEKRISEQKGRAHEETG
jgi:F-type H+-transporting ATPase subunit b